MKNNQNELNNEMNNEKNEGKEWICRPYITLRNGQRLYASSVGKKAFCFWAKPRQS